MLRILTLWTYGTNFDETKTEILETTYVIPLDIIPTSQPDWIADMLA